ncbi:PseG/SpsG family protein [Actinomycetota bacterium]
MLDSEATRWPAEGPTSDPSPSNPAIGLRVDAGQAMGVGHAVRCLAIADELRSRGLPVTVLGALDVPWVRESAAARGIPVIAAAEDPGDFAAQADSLGLAAVVIDGYGISPALGQALRDAGTTVLAMVDEQFGAGQVADVYVDQNLGAVRLAGLDADRQMLAGLDYALFRDEVVGRRPEGPREEHRPLRVLGVFGGTDPMGAAPVVTRLVLETGLPVELVVVSARPEVTAELEALDVADGQRLEISPPIVDLAGLAAGCDAAVTASGSSVWELLCLGLPSGVVCVVDNQRPGYTETTGRGVAVGIGHLEELRSDEGARLAAVGALAGLLGDAGLRRRLAESGMTLVDGRGRVRVVDALLAAVAASAADAGGSTA